MENFSWNLGGEDIELSESQQAHPESVTPAPELPALVAPSVPSPLALGPASASDRPLSRRELRRREKAFSAAAKSAAVSAPATAPATTPETAAPESTTRRAARAGRIRSTPAKSPRATKAPRTRSSRPRGRTGRRRTLFSKLFSISAMVGVAALMVSTTLPANAFYSASDAAGSPMKSFTSHAQSMKVASSAVETTEKRDGYTVSSLAEQLRLKYGNRSYSYTNDINGTIQWPFPVPVPISSGFGPRIAPCGGCSSYHEGVDFTPGRGVAIGAIADGVVSAVVATHGGLGNNVVVDHIINGQKVQSVYGHMLDNSFKVTVGEHVKVTQTLGLVGSTGESTGAHLHLEIHINGVPVDPFAWLKANAN